MLGYITFIILTYSLTGRGAEDFDQGFTAAGKICFIFLCTTLLIILFIFVTIIYIIYKARRKQLVLEDGIENGIDSPPKYCVEESPPTYQEAVNIEKNPIFQNPIFSDAEISIIL